MLLALVLSLILDIFSRFDGHPGTIYPVLNFIGNLLIFLLNPVIPSLWLLYAHNQIYRDTNRTKQFFRPLLAVIALNAVLVVLSQFFGWYYFIDAGNVYHRGQAFWLAGVITVTLIFAGFILIVGNRDKIDKKYFFSLLFFAVPPMAGITLQILFYGMSLMLSSVVLSMLIVYFNIQNNSMYTDYVSGVYNRKKLETYFKEKISTCTEDKTFSAILIDMDNFKAINDTYGHDAGDDALETSAKLMQSSLRSDDFIARFGGDEFYIILDVSNQKDLESAVSRIRQCFEKYNETSVKPYKLGFSAGYAVYDCHAHLKVDEFEKHIDALMYENKRSNKELVSNYSQR